MPPIISYYIRSSLLNNITHQRRMIFALVCLLAITGANAQELLMNVPITFSLNGLINYMPSSGGVATQGYSLTVGFNRYSWLGVMFTTLTSTNNYDTLILQRSPTQSSGVYTCSLSDFYVSSGRPSTLMTDTVTSLDLTTTSTSNSNTFKLTLPRTTSDTNGQDWEGGELVSICFFTSDSDFTQSTWSRQYEVCYGYQIINYVSTYRGSYLGSMNFQGINSQVYGGIYGPYLQLQLFWSRPSPTMANTSSMIIQIGNQITPDLGYDYYICGDGDYYGQNSGSLSKDLTYSGYDNGACVFATTALSVTMSYSRDVFTYDTFDAGITQSINVCLIGSEHHCSQFSLPLNYPIMTVESALSIWGPRLQSLPMLVVAFVLLIL